VIRHVALVALVLTGCGEAPFPVVDVVEGEIGGRELSVGGGGFAWEQPRREDSVSGISNYTMHLHMTGASFDPVVSLQGLPVLERHDLAGTVARADRLHLKFIRRGVGEKLVTGVFSGQSGEGDYAELELSFGSDRDPDGEPEALRPSAPFNYGTLSYWKLTVDEVTHPLPGSPGRLKGSFEFDLTSGGERYAKGIKVTLDVPLLGEWFSVCQLATLVEPEATGCQL